MWDLSWHQESPPSFEETVLMRKKHPAQSSGMFIDETHFIEPVPGVHIQYVERFGKPPFEALWFGPDLQDIKIYCPRYYGDGIPGLSVQTASDIFCVGDCSTDSVSIALEAPHEFLSEVDMHPVSLNYFSITVSITPPLYPGCLLLESYSFKLRTNYSRELSSIPNRLDKPTIRSSIRTLRPPPGHHIAGLYF